MVGRAVHELVDDPARSDLLIAAIAGCSSTTVARARAKLESTGLVQVIPPADRLAQPRSLQPCPTATAIAILGPDATPRAIADAAQVSMQAAWKALAKVRPRIADCAAATDALAVSKEVSPADAAAATDQLSVQITRDTRALADAAASAEQIRVRVEAVCERCGGQFSFIPRRDKPARVHCGQGCKRAGSGAAASYPPAIPAFPAAPDFSKGLCTHVPASQRTWWTSNETALREAARSICEVCPILFQCAEYSLSLPVHDTAIYGAMSTHQRLALKREAGR